MSPSDFSPEEEMRNRYPDVIRIAAGLVATLPANARVAGTTAAGIARDALAIVLACEAVCGIGDGE